MPVVDGRLICRAIELRKQGLTQDAIAIELGVVQGTVSVILREHGLGGKLPKPTRAERRRI